MKNENCLRCERSEKKQSRKATCWDHGEADLLSVHVCLFAPIVASTARNVFFTDQAATHRTAFGAHKLWMFIVFACFFIDFRITFFVQKLLAESVALLNTTLSISVIPRATFVRSFFFLYLSGIPLVEAAFISIYFMRWTVRFWICFEKCE